MQLSHKWTQHLNGDKEASDRFREVLLADTLVLGRLLAILEELDEDLTDKDLSIEEYSLPAFPYIKADRSGERRGIRKVINLLQFLKE